MEQQALIDQLNLRPHPEGGYFAETYRAVETIPQAGLPSRFSGERAFSTAIYFLVPAGIFSAFHRIKADEAWHFYYGSPLRVHMLHPDGEYTYQDLGADLAAGEVFQFVVSHGVWFASEPIAKEGFSLVGCTVAPGFDFEDFEMGTAKELIAQFPIHEALVSRLTRE